MTEGVLGSRQSIWFVSACGLAIMSACSSDRASSREELAATQAALTGGFADGNTSEANIVVAMDCTGTLITPRGSRSLHRTASGPRRTTDATNKRVTSRHP